MARWRQSKIQSFSAISSLLVLYAWINAKVVFCYHANGISHHIPAMIIDLLQTQREPSHLSPDDGRPYYFII